ncbi:uncharacterized protein V6R79_022913 [Siganus canaliculatus]
MSLGYLTVFCFILGLSAGFEWQPELCPGRDYRFPEKYGPHFNVGKLYFTPRHGGQRKLLMDKREAKDPRISVSTSSTLLKNVTEKDDGIYSISLSGRLFDVISLTVKGCSLNVSRTYGDTLMYKIPRQTDFIEYIPSNPEAPQMVLWNRTDPQINIGRRLKVKDDVAKIDSVIQADSGHYNNRKADWSLVTRIHLTVQEIQRYINKEVSQRLIIRNPPFDLPWTVKFIPDGSNVRRPLMLHGHLFPGLVIGKPFHQNIELNSDGIAIDDVQTTHSGLYEFYDLRGNLVQTVRVKVKSKPSPTLFYAAVVGGTLLLGALCCCCCCCMRKCCCRKSSSKRTAAAPATYYHNQPTCPNYSTTSAPGYSTLPVTLHAQPAQPATTSLGPRPATPENRAAVPGPSMGSDFLSSNAEPTFELKGVSFASAPPLSSDTTFSNVYTSSKLNFLKYGETFQILLLSNAHDMRFTPDNNVAPGIMWRRSDWPFVDYGRRKVKGDYFVIYRLTQEDSGTYELLDYRSRAFSTKKLLVQENTENFTRKAGESLEVIYFLEKRSCNIVFIPDYDSKSFEIIKHGNVVKQDSYCLHFASEEPCGFVNHNLQTTCSGRFEFKDSRGNLAMVAFLQMKKPKTSALDFIVDLLGNLILGLGTIFVVTFCYGCVKHCCCGEDSDDKSESPEDEAETEPTHPAEISGPAKHEDATAGPVFSDSEPQFELKGMDFDSAGDGVYTSDKLNFL